MKKNYLILLILLTLFPAFLSAETIFLRKNQINIYATAGYTNASNYYNNDINSISLLKDTLNQVVSDVAFDFRSYFSHAYGEYGISDNFSAYLSIPLVYYTLKETWTDEINNIRAEKNSFSLFKPAYIGLGAKYKLLDSGFVPYGIFEVRLPSGFHNGTRNDPKYPFLDDGDFEVFAGIGGILYLNKIVFEANIRYNKRTEDLKDQFLIYAEAGLQSVPNTELKIFYNYANSLSSFDNSQVFNIEHTPLQEMYHSLGLGFYLKFTEKVYADFNYSIRLLGKNTWGIGSFRAGAGVIL